MVKVKVSETRLIGISLQQPTSNSNGQSALDCKKLWEKFVNEKHINAISGKLSDEIFAAYYNYESDSTQPFLYFVGCEVEKDANIPHGMESLIIPEGIYLKINAKGIMPDCVTEAWKNIWTSDLTRTYKIDFEVYDKRSENWNDAEVDVYVSVEN